MGLFDNIPGNPLDYFQRERQKTNEAFDAYGSPGPQEQALMDAQVKAIKEAIADRQATIPHILGRLGFKIVTDQNRQKSLVRLTDDERRALMSQADQSRAKASQAYSQRAKAAATGQTKLPSFLKKDIDYQKVKEDALLEEILGPEFMKSTAGQQAVKAMEKKEEEIRQRLQDQDLAVAPGSAMNLNQQLSNTRQQQIQGLESFSNRNQGLIAGRGSLIQQMQNARTAALNKRLAELEAKRGTISGLLTLGGTVGGAALTNLSNRTSNKSTGSYPTYGGYGASMDWSGSADDYWLNNRP